MICFLSVFLWAQPVPTADLAASAAALLRNSSAPLTERMGAAKTLAASNDAAALPALLGALGDGPRSLRRAVVEAAARKIQSAATPARDLPAAAASLANELSACAKKERAADLAALLGLLAEKDAGVGPRVSAPLAEKLWGTKDFELTIRLVQTLGRAHDANALAALTSVAAQHPDEVVRTEAVRTLVHWPDAEAARALERSLGDGSPRVRDMAVVALGQRRPASGAAAIAHVLASDRWMFVRRDAAEALGNQCAREGAEPLGKAAATKTEDEDVRRAALAALVRCHDPKAPLLLLGIARQSSEDASLREAACRMAGVTHEPTLASPLVELIRSLRGEVAKESARPVVLACIRSLGPLCAPPSTAGATPASSQVAEHFLIDQLQQSAAEPLRAAAAEALGSLCDVRAREALGRALAGAETLVRGAAREALARCDRKSPKAPPSPDAGETAGSAQTR